MLEASFIAPELTNEGEDTTNALWLAESALLGAFGGFTSEPVKGAWRDPSNGRVYWDESLRYTVAADWTPEARDKLRAIASAFAWRASQESVYVRLDSGAVEFVAPVEPSAPTLEEAPAQGNA